MPNRIIRDWTDSERINNLSFQAETLFVRLMMKADDLGTYHANPKLIKAFCFPLKNIRESDITRWLQELTSAGIIALYNADNKPYLHIINFGQRLRQVNPKFPQMPKNELDKFMSATCQQYVSSPPLEVEVEEEVEEEKKYIKKEKSFKEFTKQDFIEELKLHSEKYSKEMLKDFFIYWTEPNEKVKMKFQLQKTWSTAGRLSTWSRNDFNGNSGSKPKETKQSGGHIARDGTRITMF